MRKQKLQQEAQLARDAEGARTARVEIAYEEYCAAEVERFIANELPIGEYEELFKEHRNRNRATFRLMTDA